MTGKQLKELRIGYNLTQVEFCKILKVRQPNLSAWERGVNKIPPYIKLLIEALGK